MPDSVEVEAQNLRFRKSTAAQSFDLGANSQSPSSAGGLPVKAQHCHWHSGGVESLGNCVQ